MPVPPAEHQLQQSSQPPASLPASTSTRTTSRRSRTKNAASRGGLVILFPLLVMMACPLRRGTPGMAAAFLVRPRQTISSSSSRICSSTRMAMSTRTTTDTKPPPAAASASATPTLIGALPSFSQLLTGGRALLQESLRVAQEVGPRAGFVRTLSATKAFSETARDLLVELRNYQQQQQQGGDAAVSPFTRAALAKSLRQLFERLGATYIKVCRAHWEEEGGREGGNEGERVTNESPCRYWVLEAEKQAISALKPSLVRNQSKHSHSPTSLPFLPPPTPHPHTGRSIHRLQPHPLPGRIRLGIPKMP